MELENKNAIVTGGSVGLGAAIAIGLAKEGANVALNFRKHDAEAKQVAEEIRQSLKDVVYQTIIPRTVRLAEAPSFGKPVLLYDIKSKGAQSYLNLAEEFLKR